MVDEFVLAVHEAQASELWFWVVVLGVFTVVATRATLRRLRRARIVEDVPTSRVRSASQGYVELQGHAQLMPGPPNVSPLTAIKCCWWTYRVEQRVVRRNRGRSETSWKTIARATSDEPFLLIDDTGDCVVDPWGATVMTLSGERWYGNLRHPTANMRRARYGGSYRYSERRLDVGDPLYAIGAFRTERDNVENVSMQDELRDLLAGWKRDQRRLLERFDENRDGVISIEEWELARNAARQEIEASRRERGVRPGLDILASPGDDRPFLLAALPQPRVARRLRSAAALLIILSMALAGLVLAILYTRYA